MADVRPLPGLRYSSHLGADLSSLITPPYDVISTEERLLYYHQSPYNIIRLELGEERPTDTPRDSRYTRAAATLKEWLQEGILVSEERPAFYLVEHRFPFQRSLKSRWGLLARVRAEEFEKGHIRPHEVTMRGPSADRWHLLQACRANFSPVMGLFRARRGAFPQLVRSLIGGEPQVWARDTYGAEFRLWVVADEEGIERVSQFFADRVLYIADGHHRYETAVRYRREQEAHRDRCRGDEAFHFVLMSLTDSQDPGLVMLPTHRVVRGLDPKQMAELRERLSTHFREDSLLPPCPALADRVLGWIGVLRERSRGAMALGLYGLHGDRLCVLVPRDGEQLYRLLPPDKPRPWKNLDVTLLHRVVLEGFLGLQGPEDSAGRLEYTRDPVEAVSLIDSRECQLAFFLNPTPVSSMLAVAHAGARMPQKSTYFYPKTPAGLVINPLWD